MEYVSWSMYHTVHAVCVTVTEGAKEGVWSMEYGVWSVESLHTPHSTLHWSAECASARGAAVTIADAA